MTENLRISMALLLASCGALAACGSEASAPGTDDVGQADVADVSDATIEDTGIDTAPLDVSLDTAGDASEDTGEVGELGDDCDLNTDCADLQCVRIDSDLETGFCSQICNDNEDCPEEWDCILLVEDGDGLQRCIPVDFCADVDGDGYGVGPGCAGPDCDDLVASTNPAADELCDGVDNDCDATIDDNPIGTGADCDTGFQGACGVGRLECVAGGVVECVGNVTATDELCDGIDNDCNGEVDDAGAAGVLTRDCYDGDPTTLNVGACRGGSQMCADGDWGGCAGFVLPVAEICDDVDNDCDGDEDEVDADGDGYAGCGGPGSDCLDTDGNVYPGAPEMCNGIDDNCNGNIDEFVNITYYLDQDGDGYGTSNTTSSGCGAPDGYVDVAGDCNDANENINPGAVEICDNIDQNCNSIIDDGVDVVPTYTDIDGDGYGAGSSQLRCLTDTDGDGVPDRSLDNRAPDNGDCNDTSASSYPGAMELCDGLDNSCSGAIDEPCPSPCAGSWPVTVASYTQPLIFDIDGDDVQEVFMSNGGIYTPSGAAWAGSASLPASSWLERTFADMDDDFAADVVQRNGIYRLLADDTFEAVTDYGGEVITQTQVVDIDSDGDLDVFGVQQVGESCHPVIWMTTSTSPYAGHHMVLPVPEVGGVAREARCGPTPVSVDLDGDGMYEIVHHQSWSHAASPNDGYTYIYSCDADCDDETSWELTDTWLDTPSHAGCGAWNATMAWAGDYLGDGSTSVYVTDGCDDLVWDVDGNVIGNFTESGMTSSVFDFDFDGRIDDTGCLAVADLDDDGVVDCVFGDENHINIRSGATGENFDDFPLATLGNFVRIGDLTGNGQANIITTATSGAAYCYELGPNSWNPVSEISGMYAGPSNFQRNGQIDSFEPDNVVNLAARTPVDQATHWTLGVESPFNLHSYISTPGDEDWFAIRDTWWTAVVTPPADLDIAVSLYCPANATTTRADANGVVLVRSWNSAGVGEREILDYGNTGTSTFVGQHCQDRQNAYFRVTSPDNTAHSSRPYIVNFASFLQDI